MSFLNKAFLSIFFMFGLIALFTVHFEGNFVGTEAFYMTFSVCRYVSSLLLLWTVCPCFNQNLKGYKMFWKFGSNPSKSRCTGSTALCS